MFIYNYDNETKEYINSRVAEQDPAETQKQGHFVPLVPANATLAEPPVEQFKKARIFKEGAWIYTNDYRGDFKINGEMIFTEITKLNEDLDGYDIKTFSEKEIVENEGINKYKFIDNRLIHKTQEELDVEERQRLDMLFLTKREVFLAIYNDKHITPEQIRSMIQTEEGKIEFDYANDYFRGNPLIKQIGNLLGYTDKELDDMFLNKSFGE